MCCVQHFEQGNDGVTNRMHEQVTNAEGSKVD